MDNRIRIQRAIKRVSQQQVADAVGVRVQTINAIENNKYGPSLLLAMRIALYFEITVDQLFFLEDGDKELKID